MTPTNLGEIKGANQRQGKSGGNSMIFYVTIIDLTANVNPNQLIFQA